MNVRKAAERLEVSQATIYGLVASSKLHCVRIGNGRGTIRILEEHIAEFLNAAQPVIRQAEKSTGRPHLKHIRLS